MFISCLLIDVGSNPDRPRPGRLWLRNVYRVHQRLCMAFPSNSRKAEDENFLKPYSPADFAANDVHVERGGDSGFLFRIDPRPGGNAAILVLSAKKPEWEYAFKNAQYLLAAPLDDPKPLRIDLPAGSLWRFRLQANPVYRARSSSLDRQGQPIGEKWIGKRLPVPSDDESLHNWLRRRSESCGFQLVEINSIQSGYVYFTKAHTSGEGQRLRSARYEGVLRVTESNLFLKTLSHGIGPAKAFGFGLLSIASVREDHHVTERPASAPQVP
ncbi:MAG: hypothetical protein AMXMBFR75_32770 [Candidatus Hinthialibacteria bacterium]|nr:type I-E CRISPR-associated protein Cas6/Cse3/CasE [bacterium]